MYLIYTLNKILDSSFFDLRPRVNRNFLLQTLNGLESYDPDNSHVPMHYQWTCETLEGFPCVVSDSDNPDRKIRAEEAFAELENTPGLIGIAAARFPLNEE